MRLPGESASLMRAFKSRSLLFLVLCNINFQDFGAAEVVPTRAILSERLHKAVLSLRLALLATQWDH